MIFENLSLFQNIIFIIAILSTVLLIVYLILPALDYYKSKEIINSDDIDRQTEPFEDINGFILSAFKIKGSLFFLTFASWFCFLFSFFLADWISALIGILIGVCATIIIGLLERKPVGQNGDLAIVSLKIPAKKTGMGKVILLESDSEIDAETEGRSIKKGKNVVVIKNLITKVVVEKQKRKKDETRAKKKVIRKSKKKDSDKKLKKKESSKKSKNKDK